MHLQQPLIKLHRFARLVAGAQCALAWVALAAGAAPRLHRQRRRALFDLDAFARYIGRLMFIRAAELTRLRPRPTTDCRNAPAGFRRRRSENLRGAIGSEMRRYLKRGEGGDRVARLLDALGNIDALARDMLRRLRRGLTRRRPLIAAAPPQHACVTQAEPGACAADTS